MSGGSVHALPQPQGEKLVRERGRVRGVLRAEAAVAAAVEGRAERAAARLGHRSKAGRSVRHRDTDRAAAFAFDAHAVGRDARLAALDLSLIHISEPTRPY